MKSISRSNARFSPARGRPLAGRGRATRTREFLLDVHHAEQVVDPVVECVRVALEVEEQVAGVGLGQDGEPALLVDRLTGRRQQQLVDRLRQSSTLYLDAGLLADALDAGCARPVERRVERDRRRCEAFDGVQLAGNERLALPRRDAGDQGEVVVLSTPCATQLRPAADVAVLDRLRVGIGRWVAGGGGGSDIGPEHGCLEACPGGAVVGHVVVDAQVRRLPRAPPRTTCISSGGTPWIAVSCSTYEQIWSTAPALTCRASFVSATS